METKQEYLDRLMIQTEDWIDKVLAMSFEDDEPADEDNNIDIDEDGPMDLEDQFDYLMQK